MKKAAMSTATRRMTAAATIPPMAPFESPPPPLLPLLDEPALAVASVLDTVEGKNFGTTLSPLAVETVVGVDVVTDVLVSVKVAPP